MHFPGPFNIRQDQRVTRKLLEQAPVGSAFKFGTGYFNLTEEYMKSILEGSSAGFDLLMAHPKVIKYTKDVVTKGLAARYILNLIFNIVTYYLSISSSYRIRGETKRIIAWIPCGYIFLFYVLPFFPKANGFLGASFPLGGIPHAYTLIARQFFSAVGRTGQSGRIRLHEYQRQGWTFHGKGLWLYPPKGEGDWLPMATMVGSPNFGYRSVERDLEAQVGKTSL